MQPNFCRLSQYPRLCDCEHDGNAEVGTIVMAHFKFSPTIGPEYGPRIREDRKDWGPLDVQRAACRNRFNNLKIKGRVRRTNFLASFRFNIDIC